MCSHSPSSAQTSAMASSSSTAPTFVVPRLATTANSPSVPDSVERLAQRGAGHPATLVGRHQDDVDVHDVRGGVHRCVGLARGGEAPPGRPVAATLAGVVAGGDERRQVGRRAAADEAAAGARREPGQPGQPVEGLVLGGDGAGPALPQPAEDARRADDEVEQVGRRRRRGRDVGEVQRRVHRAAGVHQDVAEQGQGAVAADAVRCDRAVEDRRPARRPAGRPTSGPSTSSAARPRTR